MNDSPENPPFDDDFDPDEGWKNEEDVDSFNIPKDKLQPKKQPKSKFLNEISKVAVKVGTTVGKVAVKVGDTVGTIGKYVGAKIEDSLEDINEQIKEKKRFDTEVKKYQAEMHSDPKSQKSKVSDNDIWQDAVVTPKSSVGSPPKPAIVSSQIRMVKENESIFDQFTLEMRELYQNAHEFLELGQETQAINCYDLLLHKAEEMDNSDVIQFLRQERNSL